MFIHVILNIIFTYRDGLRIVTYGWKRCHRCRFGIRGKLLYCLWEFWLPNGSCGKGQDCCRNLKTMHQLQQQMGHRNIHSTLRYVHWVPNYRDGQGGTDLIADPERRS